MTIRQNQDGSASIEAYSLGEFTKEVVELCQSGYWLKLDINEGNPVSFGVFMTITMYPTETKEVTHILTVNGVQVGKISNLQVEPLKEVIEAVKNEGVQEDVAFNNSEQSPKESKTDKIDGRRKKS